MSKNKEIDSIAAKILANFRVWAWAEGLCCEPGGVWIFRYNRQLTQLETWTIRVNDSDPERKFAVKDVADIEKKIDDSGVYNSTIPKGEGTIGYLVESVEHARNNTPIFVGNLANDPRGVVSLIDTVIGQESAYLVPLFGANSELIGVADFYFAEDEIGKLTPNALEKLRTGKCDMGCLDKDSSLTEKLRLHYRLEAEQNKSEAMLKHPEFGSEEAKKNLDQKSDQELTLALLEDIQKILTEVAPVYLLTYGDETEKQLKAIKFDFLHFARLFRNELRWCSYQSTLNGCCVLGGTGTCDFEKCSPVVRLMSKVYKLFEKRSIPLTGDDKKEICRIVLYLPSVPESTTEEIKELEKQLNKFFTPIFKSTRGAQIAEKKKKYDAAQLLAEILFNGSPVNSVLKLINRELSGVCEFTEEDVSEAVKIFEITDIKGAFILCPPDAKWVASPVTGLSNEMLRKLKLSASIKPIYSVITEGVLEEASRSLGNYKPLLTADGASVGVRREEEGKQTLTITYKNGAEDTTFNWTWEKNDEITDKLDLVYSYVSEGLQQEISNELVDAEKLREEISGAMGHEGAKAISVPLKETNFLHIHSRTKPTEDVKKEIQAHIHGLYQIYQTVIEKKNALQHARKSAAAAIMARNMSHNIGSHVLNYLAEKDQFYGYLRDKMNFITEIVTSTPKWGVKMEFLTEVLLPFCGITDGLSDAEKRKFNKAQADLLGNIFKSEITTGDPLSKLKFTYKVDGKQVVDIQVGNNVDTPSLPEDWSGAFVSMPHGVIGCHAFYSFMEGFIRNSAKHNRSKLNSDGLHITIDLSSSGGDLYKLCVSDNISEFRTLNCAPCDYTKPDCKNCRTYINKGIAEELTNSAGSITGAWGLKELSMCAKWLRRIPADAASSQQTPPLLKLTEKDVWELYLSKPKDVLLVGPELNKYKDESQGVYFLPDLAAFEASVKANKLTYSMVVLDGADKELLLWLGKKVNLLRLPYRLFVFNGNNMNGDSCVNICAEDLKSGIMDGLYKALISKWFGSELPKIAVNANGTIYGNANGVNPQVKGDLFEFMNSTPRAEKIYFTHQENDLAVLPVAVEYAAGFSTSSTVDSFYTMLRASEKDPSIQYKICEFALLKVLVVDERMFRDSATSLELPKALKQPLWKHWRRMGVEFATFENETNIKIRNGNECIEQIALADYQPLKKFDFLSIHQALIGDVIKERWDTVLPALEKFARNIVIHSARGDVKVLSGHKFIDYSNLRSVLIDRPDKQALAERLMSLTGEGGKQ